MQQHLLATIQKQEIKCIQQMELITSHERSISDTMNDLPRPLLFYHKAFLHPRQHIHRLILNLLIILVQITTLCNDILTLIYSNLWELIDEYVCKPISCFIILMDINNCILFVKDFIKQYLIYCINTTI